MLAISRHLPKRLQYWVLITVWAKLTSGEHGDRDPMAITMQFATSELDRDLHGEQEDWRLIK